MNQFSSVSSRSLAQWRKEDRWLERLCTGGLLLAALFLLVSNLGNLPLTKEEANLSQIGQGMAQVLFPGLPLVKQLELETLTQNLVAMTDRLWWTEWLSHFRDLPHWLQGWQPTLAGKTVNQPPLVSWLMALSYGLGGINPWTTRLAIALLTAVSVPMLYRVAKELFRQRLTALYAGLIYLTS
ncbi:MAG: ArnT family glycosyltransferase, partial [Microcystaceae cyanobacterium]